MLSSFRNAIVDFTHAHTGTITHALVDRTAPRPDLSEARSKETYENERGS